MAVGRLRLRMEYFGVFLEHYRLRENMPMARRTSPSFLAYTSRRGRPPLSVDRPLTEAELLRARLVLAEDMVHLVLEDGSMLPPLVQETLRQVSQVLNTMHRQARDRPQGFNTV